MPSDWKDKMSISVAVGKLGENSFVVMRLFLTVACGLDYKKKHLLLRTKIDVVLLF